MDKEVYIPKYFKGIKKSNRSFPQFVNVLAGDTETYNGIPYLLSLCNNNEEALVYEVDTDNILDVFIKYLDKNSYLEEAGSRIQNVMFFHNMKFDLPILLYKYMDKFLNDEFIITYLYDFANLRYVSIEVYANKIFMCKIKIGKIKSVRDEHGNIKQVFKNPKIITILDSFNFFRKSLDSLCKDLDLPIKKMKRPDGIGERKILDDYMLEYAKNDALAEWYLGKYIINFHESIDVPLSVSIAQLAQRYFCKHCLKENEHIYLPRNDIMNYALLSYHGGKNGYYLDGVQRVRDVYVLDVVSMYPFIMLNMPPITSGSYRQTSSVCYDYEGIYKVSGYVRDCTYPIICDHDFKYKSDCYINDIWTTSYELKEAIIRKEIDIDKCEGYIWIPDKKSYNPLETYVKYFFDKKNTTPRSNPNYLFFKILLNSLYGKFVQTVEEKYYMNYKDMELCMTKWKAGGLFNPFIATLITGGARAYLHELEHEYKSIHSSTDSIMTTIRPHKEHLKDELGGLQIEAFGDAMFIRNKVYAVFDDRIKVATHGFQGNIEDLIKLYINKEYEYEIDKMIQVKEGLIHEDKIPMTFMKLKRVLNVEWN